MDRIYKAGDSMTQSVRREIRKHREFLLYALFGVGTVVIDVGLYTLLVEPLGVRWANAWGWCGAVLFAFWTNKYFVFRRGREGFRAFLREFAEFTAVRIASLLVEVYGVELLMGIGLDDRLLGVTGGYAKLVATVAAIIINYIFSKFLIFRRREENP